MDRIGKLRPTPAVKLSSLVLQTAENKGRLERDNELLRAELEKAQKSVQSWKTKYLKARDLLREHGITDLDNGKASSLKGSTKAPSITGKDSRVDYVCSNCERTRQLYLAPATCGENRVSMELSMALTNLEEHQALLQKFNDLLGLVKGLHFEPNSIPASLQNYLKSYQIQNLKMANNTTWSGECLQGIPHGKGILNDPELNVTEQVMMIGERRIGESITKKRLGENEIIIETYFDPQGNRHGPFKYLEKKGQTAIFYQEGVFQQDELSGPLYEKNSNPQDGFYRFGFRSVTNKYVELVMDLALTNITYVEEEHEQRTEKYFVAVDLMQPHSLLFQRQQNTGAHNAEMV